MKMILGVALLVCGLSLVHSMPSGGYKKEPDGFFQYVNVPGIKEYEFGWRRGNPHHHISRFEQAKDHRFRTRVKWADTHAGHGEHYWEYNHGPKHPGYKDDSHSSYKDSHSGYKDDSHSGYKDDSHSGYKDDSHSGYKDNSHSGYKDDSHSGYKDNSHSVYTQPEGYHSENIKVTSPQDENQSFYKE